ncbi:hypothetical protein H072_5211 [Dactylellina haptotyla CBS 200.50]|uniref:Uncharacterized protein n=1 Tax=Dactylellina haptotyla (strain CBS 200.50) TaxID=1284197 RepID=S8AIF5_DACHA|nr:hypothetical protein H072_5211 [Dactylellina haptotyla CBS 200.50]
MNMQETSNDTRQSGTPDLINEKSHKPGFKAHVKRRKWFYIGGCATLIVLLIVLLVVLFTVVPRIARDAVNNATVEVEGIAITSPSNDRVTVSMKSTVFAKVPVGGAKLSSQMLETFIPDGNSPVDPPPFMVLPVGELDVKDRISIDLEGLDTNILNQDLFQQFSTNVLRNEFVSLGIRSNPQPTVNIGAMKILVDFRKTVTVKGFNMMRGITITKSTLLDTPLADGTNMLSEGNIPNPSDFTMEVGDLTGNITIGLIPIGFSVIKNLTLRPGDNKVLFNVHVNPLLNILPFITNIIIQQNVNLLVDINSVVSNGQHVTWLENPMAAISPLTVVMNPDKPKLPFVPK